MFYLYKVSRIHLVEQMVGWGERGRLGVWRALCVCSKTREETITLLKINTEGNGLSKTLNSGKIFTSFKI